MNEIKDNIHQTVKWKTKLIKLNALYMDWCMLIFLTKKNKTFTISINSSKEGFYHYQEIINTMLSIHIFK